MKRIIMFLYIIICMSAVGIESSLNMEKSGKILPKFHGLEAYFERILYLQPAIEEIYLLGFKGSEVDSLKKHFEDIEFSNFSMEKNKGESGGERALVVKDREETSDLEKLNYPIYGYRYAPRDEFTMVLYPDGKKSGLPMREKLFFNYPKAKEYKLNYFLLEGGYSFYNMDGHFFVIDKRNLNKIIISFHLTIIVSFIMFYLIISRRKLVKELIETRLKAEEASLEKGRFLANMSHEIRTPLSGIIGTVETLKDIPMDRKIGEKLRVIGGASHHLLEIINDILDFSKIEANKIEIHRNQFSLRETLAEVLQIFESIINRRNLRLVCICAKDTPHFVVGDRLALRKILINLIGNAVKFTHEGEITICVKIDESKDIYFKVTDTGIGIPQEMVEKITEDFIQGQQGNLREYEGTGLGLAITSRFLSLMGSKLMVESTVGVGSSFYFKLSLPKGKDRLETSTEGFILYTASKEIKEIFQQFGDDYSCPYIIVSDEEAFMDMSEDGEVILDYPHIFIGEDLYHSEKHGLNCTVVSDSPVELKKVSVICMNPLFNWKIYRSMEKVIPKETEIKTRDIKALIVDDSTLNLNVLKDLLEKNGIVVISASRGSKALELLTDDIDIVFTDIQMPGMDGYELAERIKKIDMKLPVVAITANAFLEDRIKALKGSLDAYVTKPFQRDDLIEAIENLIPHLKVERLVDELGSEGIIADCLKEIPEGIFQLKKALEEKSCGKIKYYAHKLKGEFSYLKEDKIRILLEEIERDSENFEQKIKYLENIEVRWNSLRERIEKGDSI
ncbi:response regulator [Fusobacteria bacterium ZRK30]|nr:response regulator [Fusobacteria bacterium ZRK30]